MLETTRNNSSREPLSQSTRRLLAKHDFTPKKKLGQNFIIDKAALDRIISAGELTEKDLVIEIGTGLGTLTKELAGNAGKVISIEYDKILYEIAKDNLKGHNNVELIRDDFLKIDLRKLIKEQKEFKNYKVIANLPYYITAPIITKLIEAKPAFSLAVLTVQREVGERMVAGPGSKKFGSLSLFIQYHSDVEINSDINKSGFLPHPAVSSSIIVMRPKIKPPVEVKNEKLLFDAIHAAFEHRRKTLRNAILLSHKFDISKEKLDEALHEAGIDGNRRGETLAIEEFATLADTLA
jgi:16S rRNA (adenine1518-N6/adenine1519-N6)-dimethyltransferase